MRDNLGQGSFVKTTTLRWAMTNDDRNIYIALEWTDDTYDHDFDINLGPRIFDGVKLLFDNDGNGALEDGEDERTVIAAIVGSLYIDQHAVPSGDESDLIGDGFAKLSYHASTNLYQAEFLFPLARDSAGEDADLTVQTRYNIILFDHADLTGPPNASNAGFAFSGDSDSSLWPDLFLIQAEPHDYPDLPAGLTGLIVFISDHEQSKGDIYSFDP